MILRIDTDLAHSVVTSRGRCSQVRVLVSRLGCLSESWRDECKTMIDTVQEWLERESQPSSC